MKQLITFGAAAFVIAACGGLTTEDTASISTALGRGFTNLSLKVHGVRTAPASSLYPCANELDACVGLDRNGLSRPVINLCPSNDTPNGTWSFKYAVYVDGDCRVLAENLACEPKTEEWLRPGHNSNEVRCITRNADKSFDLCVIDPVTGAQSDLCPKPCEDERGGQCGGGVQERL